MVELHEVRVCAVEPNYELAHRIHGAGIYANMTGVY